MKIYIIVEHWNGHSENIFVTNDAQEAVREREALLEWNGAAVYEIETWGVEKEVRRRSDDLPIIYGYGFTGLVLGDVQSNGT